MVKFVKKKLKTNIPQLIIVTIQTLNLSQSLNKKLIYFVTVIAGKF
jgi:hypothetical protein